MTELIKSISTFDETITLTVHIIYGSIIKYTSFKAWFGTCIKKLLSVLSHRCPDLAKYTDFFTLKRSNISYMGRCNEYFYAETKSLFSIAK